MSTAPKILEVLSPSAREWIESEVESGGFVDEIDYINRLIESARKLKEELRADLMEGLTSLERGEGIEFDAEELKRAARSYSRNKANA